MYKVLFYTDLLGQQTQIIEALTRKTYEICNQKFFLYLYFGLVIYPLRNKLYEGLYAFLQFCAEVASRVFPT